MNIFGFLGEVRNELTKVVWPTKKETLKYTVTVIVFSLAVAFLLGAFDYGILRVFESIVAR